MPYFLHVFICTFLLIIQIPFCYSQRLYQPFNLILPNNDTINKLNKDGLYEGFHVITDNYENLTTDENYYKKGYFNNGVPVDNWIEHYSNGTWGIGEYVVATETYRDGNNKEVTYLRGTGAKTGIWIYYNADSTLWKTVLHETKIHGTTTITKESVKIDSSSYVLSYYKKTRGKIISKEVIKNNNGTLLSTSTRNFIRNKTIKYNRHGKKQSISLHSNIFYRSSTIQFDRHGKKTSKTISKQWKRKMEGCPAYFW